MGSYGLLSHLEIWIVGKDLQEESNYNSYIKKKHIHKYIVLKIVFIIYLFN